MDSKTAKRAATKLEATLVYGKDEKAWTLTASNSNSTSISSAQLKVMDKDELEDEVVGLIVTGSEAVVEKKSKGRKARYPIQVRPSRTPINVTPIKVILPEGNTIEGGENSNYFFFEDGSNLKSVRKDWAVGRFENGILDMQYN